MRSAITWGLLLVGGCVYPATEPTGIELSWRFMEGNQIDGEDATQVRSCAGAVTEQIAVEIEDTDDPTRHRTFRFDCRLGYQTATDLQLGASDAFVRLDPGAYALRLHAVDDASDAPIDEQVAEREVDVSERGVTVETFALTRAPIAWALELQGLEACESMTLGLHYATPETDLAEYAPLPDDDSLPLYRQALRSDRGLHVGGEATPCDEALAGVHRFEGIDRGQYQLALDVDGVACTVVVDLRPRDDGSSVIDLANLPCGG